MVKYIDIIHTLDAFPSWYVELSFCDTECGVWLIVQISTIPPLISHEKHPLAVANLHLCQLQCLI